MADHSAYEHDLCHRGDKEKQDTMRGWGWSWFWENEAKQIGHYAPRTEQAYAKYLFLYGVRYNQTDPSTFPALHSVGMPAIPKPVVSQKSTWQQFVDRYLNRRVTDPWGNYLGECVSLAKRWIEFNDWPPRWGNAIMWSRGQGGNGYIVVPNKITTVPRRGDFAVFESGVYGHIGIVESANLFKMNVLNQNWPLKSPVHFTTFNYRTPKCVAFLRRV